jgi:hypothetical protein
MRIPPHGVGQNTFVRQGKEEGGDGGDSDLRDGGSNWNLLLA